MSSKKMFQVFAVAAVVGILFWGWKLTSRSAYESAEYTVLKSDGSIEVRQYPDLMLVTTEMSSRSQTGDGSFGRLFQYISGNNNNEQKVAMTTPVFIDQQTEETEGRMGFVLPKKVAADDVPEPSSDQVQLAKRDGGKFAVIRFAGRTDSETVNSQTKKLEEWIAKEGLQSEGKAEVASYDPPWTPGPLRRNEVLIRLRTEPGANPTK